MFKAHLIGLVGILCSSTMAWGWGSLGHRTSGHIAESRLTPQAQNAVQQLLRGQRLADASTWADSIKGDPNWKHASWYHFEKMPDNIRFIPYLSQLTPEERARGGVIGAILVSQRVLESNSTSAVEKEIALKMLVHCLGDLHQPLHSGKPDDRGGVRIPVNWFNQPQSVSLHSLWDTGIKVSGHPQLFQRPTNSNDVTVEYARFLIQKFQNWSPPIESEANPERWLAESLQLRPRAYDRAYETNQRAYLANNLDWVDFRVYQSGLRIAEVLNRIFAGQPVPRAEVDLWQSMERLVGRLTNVIVLAPRAPAPGAVPEHF